MNPRHPWTRREVDELEALLAAGHRYADIAERMGRTFNSIRAKVEYLGLHGRGLHWKAKDPAMVAKIRDIIAECVDFRGMPCKQVTRHLNAIGYEVSNAWVYKQLCDMGPHMRKWAKENARRAISVTARLSAQRRERDPEGNWKRRFA